MELSKILFATQVLLLRYKQESVDEFDDEKETMECVQITLRGLRDFLAKCDCSGPEGPETVGPKPPTKPSGTPTSNGSNKGGSDSCKGV